MTPSEIYNCYLTEISDIKDHLPTLRAAACGNVLEIGVRTGISTSALLCGVEEHGGHVYSVDVDNCLIFAEHPQWTFLHKNSVVEKESILAAIPKELDLLFIDGDHSYEGCLSDLMTYSPLAKTVAIHDTEAPLWPGVRSAVREYISTNRFWNWEFIKESYGLAILTR